MPRLSAGLLVYRVIDGIPEVLIGHPGGPFWARKDAGAWTIPKGEYDDTEDPWTAARREFAEEVGLRAPDGQPIAFEPLRQPSGKMVTVFAVEADLDVRDAVSNTFTMEWPRGSGVFREYPELDRVAWFSVVDARDKLLKGQRPLLDLLLQQIGRGG
ncbi:NUDIX domain-containing protein [Mycobacterium sp. MBM]|nr:NUDIX domain-containing protein [Mycobacterium sp. MBM]